MAILKGELQADNGDVLYPHTSAEVVFMEDGKSVEEVVKNIDTVNGVKFYKSLQEINSTFTESTELKTVIQTMANNSRLMFSVGSPAGVYPMNYSTVIIDKISNDRNFAYCYGNDGKRLFTTAYHVTSNPTCTWVEQGKNADTVDGKHASDFFPVLGGDLHGALKFKGIRALQWDVGRPNLTEIFWNASASNDFGLTHRVAGQDVLVLKSDGVNTQKPLYANAGVNTPLLSVTNYEAPIEIGAHIDFHKIGSGSDHDARLSLESGALVWRSAVNSAHTMNITQEIIDLKSSVVNGKQQVVNAINGKLGYSSGLTTNNTHADYAWWITNKIPGQIIMTPSAQNFQRFDNFPRGRRLGGYNDGGSISISALLSMPSSPGADWTITCTQPIQVYMPNPRETTGTWTTYNAGTHKISGTSNSLNQMMILNPTKTPFTVSSNYGRDFYAVIE